MKLLVFISAIALFSSVLGEEAKTEKVEGHAKLPMQHRSAEPVVTNPHEAVARVQSNKKHITSNPTSYAVPQTHVQQPPVVAVPASYQQLGIGANVSPYQVNPSNSVPGGAYHQVYQQQQQELQQQQAQVQAQVQAQSPVYLAQAATFVPPKEDSKVKKPVHHVVKDNKPHYYPKESTYSSIPAQPGQEVVQTVSQTNNSPRFVADPSRSHLVEEVSDSHLQQLTYRPQPQYYAGASPAGVPAYTNFVGGVSPGVPVIQPPYYNPQANGLETETVTYEQTEHGFMDRVWGEVETMRQTITTDFFGAIPTFFRNIWDTIVGAVSSASARMLTIDWVTVFDFIRKGIE